ncbi:MAG: Dna2/Cas4 domain-containing protein, partial [Anaerococcus sp.]|nr:Dna2/Cas4 domain-containing protein [Anaerococcus sp.]
MYGIDDYLMLSGIQHFLFCKRQWALIHIENLWEENILIFIDGRCIKRYPIHILSQIICFNY